MEEDYISSLPDTVVCHILSRLPSKDAVRTSILSRDWVYKWTFIYNINVSIAHELTTEKLASFSCFMTRILESTVKSIRLSGSYYDIREQDQFKGRLSRVFTSNVENIEIRAVSFWNLDLTDFSVSSSLRELNLLLSCTLNADVMQNCFPSLKRLCIGGGSIEIVSEKSDTGLVFMIFPVLEDLEWCNCKWVIANSVEIHAPELTKFKTTDSTCVGHPHTISIIGPKLAMFELQSCYKFVIYAPGVTRAVLCYRHQIPSGLRAHEILKWFPHLQSLRLSVSYSNLDLTDLSVSSSLRELDLLLSCTLNADVMQNCFPSLKRLCIGGGSIKIVSEKSDTGLVLMIFPVLEDLELRNCKWVSANSVEIHVPELTKFKARDSPFEGHPHTISIIGPKLAIFELQRALPGNFVIYAPGVTHAVLCYRQQKPSGLRAHEILKWFPHLQSLRLSESVVEELVQRSEDFNLTSLCELKRLELCPCHYSKQYSTLLDHNALRSIESLDIHLKYLTECDSDSNERQFYSRCILPQLSEVKFINYLGSVCQKNLIKFFLREVNGLERASIVISSAARHLTENGVISNLMLFVLKLQLVFYLCISRMGVSLYSLSGKGVNIHRISRVDVNIDGIS